VKKLIREQDCRRLQLSDGKNLRRRSSGALVDEVLVTAADVMENQPLLDLLWRARCRWRLPVRQVTGGTTYGAIENIVALEDQGIRAFVPLPDFDERAPYYGASKFVYDPQRDAYDCPASHPLDRWKATSTEEVIVYRAEAAICTACPVKSARTGTDKGRQVRRSFYAAELDRVRSYHQTVAYDKAVMNAADAGPDALVEFVSGFPSVDPNVKLTDPPVRDVTTSLKGRGRFRGSAVLNSVIV
jgi:hypothetical protein